MVLGILNMTYKQGSAYTKGSTTRYVRLLGQKNEVEICGAMDKMEESEVKNLYELTRKLHSHLQSVKVEEVKEKKQKNKNLK